MEKVSSDKDKGDTYKIPYKGNYYFVLISREVLNDFGSGAIVSRISSVIYKKIEEENFIEGTTVLIALKDCQDLDSCSFGE